MERLSKITWALERFQLRPQGGESHLERVDGCIHYGEVAAAAELFQAQGCLHCRFRSKVRNRAFEPMCTIRHGLRISASGRLTDFRHPVVAMLKEQHGNFAQELQVASRARQGDFEI